MTTLPHARLLARAAAVQGRAVPVTRFEFQKEAAGVAVTSLSLQTAMTQAWRTVFPEGQSQSQATFPTKEHFPVVFLPNPPAETALADNPPDNATEDRPSAHEPLLLRGATSQLVMAEDSNGRHYELPIASLAQGRFLLLRVPRAGRMAASSDTSSAAMPKTAKQWFYYAIYKRRRLFIEGALATLLIGMFGLAASLYTMQVYDRVIPLKGYSTLAVLTAGVAIAIVMELVMKQVRAVVVERSCKAVDQELSDVFFSKALSIRLDARPRTVGTFASQIRHFESVRTFMTSTTLMVLADIPLALLFIAVISLIAGPIALVPLVAIPLALIAGLAFKRPIRSLTKDQIEESNFKNGLLIEAIDGIESLKASGAEWKMQSKWSVLTRILAGKELKLRLITNFSSQLTQTVHQVCYVGIVALGAYAVAEGNLTMGGLIACSIIASRALQPISQLPAVVAQWQSAAVSLEALDAIMAMPNDRQSDQQLVVPDTCHGALRLENIQFQYEPGQTVLNIPGLQISAGERVAILGAVGSGKSTLIKLLSGLYQPKQGQSYLDDIDMFQLAPEFVREHVAYLPQDIRLFNGSLRDNLTLGLPNPSDAIIMQAASACGLAAAISQHPKGLDLLIQEGGRGLSGGQRQLVGLTRMLLARPSALLLDEPTASMDGQLENYVLQHLFEELPKHTTVVMATHKAASLRYVQRVVVMHQGGIALNGPRDDVLRKLNASSAQQGAGTQAIASVTND